MKIVDRERDVPHNDFGPRGDEFVKRKISAEEAMAESPTMKVELMQLRPFKSLLLIGLLVVSASSMTGCPLFAPANIVLFPDDRLETAVRSELRKPFGFITQADMLKVYRLDARNFAVRDLRGLEFAKNLAFFDVSNEQRLANTLGDISPLTDLVNLSVLDLSNNDVTDLGPLAGLFNLDLLFLDGNDIFDLDPLVANADNGGLRAGDTVTLSPGPLEVGEDGDESGVQPSTAENLRILREEHGVTVVFVVTGSN